LINKEEEEVFVERKTEEEGKWRKNKKDKMLNPNKTHSLIRTNKLTMLNKKKRLTSIEYNSLKIQFFVKFNNYKAITSLQNTLLQRYLMSQH